MMQFYALNILKYSLERRSLLSDKKCSHAIRGTIEDVPIKRD